MRKLYENPHSGFLFEKFLTNKIAFLETAEKIPTAKNHHEEQVDYLTPIASSAAVPKNPLFERKKEVALTSRASLVEIVANYRAVWQLKAPFGSWFQGKLTTADKKYVIPLECELLNFYFYFDVEMLAEQELKQSNYQSKQGMSWKKQHLISKFKYSS